jgi:hypothetical protein
MGQIMLMPAVAAFGAAALFLVLSGLGCWHLHQSAPEPGVFPKVASEIAVKRLT